MNETSNSSHFYSIKAVQNHISGTCHLPINSHWYRISSRHYNGYSRSFNSYFTDTSKLIVGTRRISCFNGKSSVCASFNMSILATSLVMMDSSIKHSIVRVTISIAGGPIKVTWNLYTVYLSAHTTCASCTTISLICLPNLIYYTSVDICTC